MWERIFLLSVVVYFIGVLVILMAHFVVPDWGLAPVAVAVGGLIAGGSGLVGIVSGLVLVFKTPLPGSSQ